MLLHIFSALAFACIYNFKKILSASLILSKSSIYFVRIVFKHGLKPLRYFMTFFGVFCLLTSITESLGKSALHCLFVCLVFFFWEQEPSGKNVEKSISDARCHVCFSAMLYHLYSDSETLEKFLSGCIILKTSEAAGNTGLWVLKQSKASVLHTRIFLYVHLLAQLAVPECQVR